MIFYDTILAAIVLGGAALNVGLHLLRRSLADVALRLQTEQGKLFSTSVVGLQSIETLKATGGEDDFFAKWAGYHARAINSEQKLAIFSRRIDLLPPIASQLDVRRRARRRCAPRHRRAPEHRVRWWPFRGCC